MSATDGDQRPTIVMIVADEDIEPLAQSPLIPDSIAVSAMLYDVTSGRVEMVERRSPMRPAEEPSQ